MGKLTGALLARGEALRGEKGQTLVEYALIILLVAIALVLSLQFLAGGLDQFYQAVTAAF